MGSRRSIAFDALSNRWFCIVICVDTRIAGTIRFVFNAVFFCIHNAKLIVPWGFLVSANFNKPRLTFERISEGNGWVGSRSAARRK